MSKTTIVGFGAVVLMTGSALAEPPPQAPPPDEAGASAAVSAGGVVVTAQRSPAPAERVAASVTVLTSQDLRADQEPILADVLARTPGVNVVRNGGPGEVTSLFIRGAASDHTLVLIDGVRVNDQTDPAGGFDFSTLETSGVARVEVLRGPQSTLYGSDAIGGVVNVVTLEAARPFEGEARLEGGSYGSGSGAASIGGADGPAHWRASVVYDASDGVPTLDPRFGGRAPRGFDTVGASGRLRLSVTRDLELDERVYFTATRNEFDGYDTPSGAFGDDPEFGRTRKLVDYTGFNLTSFDGRLKSRLAFEYAGLDRRNEDPIQPLTKFTFLAAGRTSTVEYEGALAVASGFGLIFGAEGERDSIALSTPFYAIAYGEGPVGAGRTRQSGYLQAAAEPLTGLTLVGGVRYDARTTYGDHVTGQAALAWRLGSTTLRANVGQGFKAPSLYELYSPYGNLRLRPESATGWDASVEQRLMDGRLVAQATYFERTTRDLIDFVSCYGVDTPVCNANVAGGYYDNVERARAAGVELSARLQLPARLALSGNYTYDAAEDRSPGARTFGLQLPRRPKDEANFALDAGPYADIRAGVAIRYVGASFDDTAHLQRLKAFTLVDLRASRPVAFGAELYGRIENLFDQRYETAYRYATLGRAVYGGVRWRF